MKAPPFLSFSATSFASNSLCILNFSVSGLLREKVCANVIGVAVLAESPWLQARLGYALVFSPNFQQQKHTQQSCGQPSLCANSSSDLTIHNSLACPGSCAPDRPERPPAPGSLEVPDEMPMVVDSPIGKDEDTGMGDDEEDVVDLLLVGDSLAPPTLARPVCENGVWVRE